MANEEKTNDPTLDVLPPIKHIDMRQAVMDVFRELGGVSAMLTWAQANTANTRIFYKDILPKVIPRQAEITGEGGGPVKMVVEWATDPSLDLRNSLPEQAKKPAAVLALAAIRQVVDG
jgi:hypothetical protein